MCAHVQMLTLAAACTHSRTQATAATVLGGTEAVAAAPPRYGDRHGDCRHLPHMTGAQRARQSMIDRRSCLLDLERPRSQRRQQPSPARPATCCRVSSSIVLVDAPARERRAAHAAAPAAATVRSTPQNAIEKKGSSEETLPSCTFLPSCIREIELDPVTRCVKFGRVAPSRSRDESPTSSPPASEQSGTGGLTPMRATSPERF